MNTNNKTKIIITIAVIIIVAIVAVLIWAITGNKDSETGGDKNKVELISESDKALFDSLNNSKPEGKAETNYVAPLPAPIKK